MGNAMDTRFSGASILQYHFYRGPFSAAWLDSNGKQIGGFSFMLPLKFHSKAV
jgi:hypothetical protein